MMRNSIFEKIVFKYGFLPWKYQQKSLKAIMCQYLLTSAEHCFGNMAEKPLSFCIVSRRIMMMEIECINLYIFIGGKVFLNKNLHCGNNHKNH